MPMSYNMWNYTLSNPVNYTDPSGNVPCHMLPPEDQVNCVATNDGGSDSPPEIADSASYHNPALNPPNISYIGKNLASPAIIDSQSSAQAQFIANNSKYAKEHNWPPYPNSPDRLHTGLCGLISVAALLNSVYPGGITANEVVDDFLAYNKYYGERSSEPWPDYQSLNELHKFIKSVYFVYLFAGPAGRGGMDDRTGMPEPVTTWLMQGGYAISGVQVGGSTGRVGTGNAGHWLVITGISRQWNKPWHDSTTISPWKWVRVYNPFTNKTEYYPWRFFKPAHEQFSGIMQVNPYPRRYTTGYINALNRCGAISQLPDFVQRRLK
jgi:hypothetical protein